MILYADDDIEDIMILQSVADELKVNLHAFKGGNEVLQKLNGTPTAGDIVFLDINMPGLNGLEVLKLIRQNETWRNVPVVMYTTSTYSEHVKESFDLGANYYLPKISDYHNLIRAVKHVMTIEWDGFKPGLSDFMYKS